MAAIKLKRTAVAAKAPAVADLELGEMAINTFDGKLYALKNNGTASVFEVGPVYSVAGKTGAVALAKADVGLGSVDNTSDASKPISTATQNALNYKQPLDDTLTALAQWTATGAGSEANLIWTYGGGTLGSTVASSFMLGIMSSASAVAARATLGAAATSHTHTIANITSLQATLDGKAAASHTHTIANITSLQATLDGKATASHTHTAGDVSETLLSKSASYTLALTDKRDFIMFTGAANVVLTVPAGGAVAFAVGDRVTVERNGVGTVKISGDAGVTINCRAALPSIPRYGVVHLIKTGTDTWLLYGDVG